MYDLIFVFFFAACLGSFSALLAYRMPLKKSIVSPASHCVFCKNKIKWYHNIPIISCLVLRAKCAFCGKYYGWRHFWIEMLMAVLLTMVYLKFGLSISAIEYAIFIFGLITITFIDLEHRIIPDVLSLGGILVGLLGSLVNPDRSFVDAFLGFFVGGGIFWLIAYVYYKIRGEMGLGGGDIKLLAWIGSVLGLSAVFPIVFLSSVLGSLWGILLMIKNRSGMATTMAFGPFLSLAAVFYLFCFQEAARLFYSFFFPWLH